MLSQKLLIIGSSSFAGGCLVNNALNAGFSIKGVSRSNEESPFFQPFYNNIYFKNYCFHQIDINKQLDELFDLISYFKPTYIVDFAGQGMVAQSWDQSWQWYTTNLVTKTKLISFLSKCDYLKKYIRISTPEVYGNQGKILTEDSIYSPSTPYAISHAAIDFHLAAMNIHKGFPSVVGRFANFYGPSQQLYRIIPRTILSILGNKKLPLHGGGHSKRSFIFGDDVADGILRMISKGELGATYHFSSQEHLSIRGIVKLICQEMNADFSDLVVETQDRLGKDKNYRISYSETSRKLNWSPNISLLEGVRHCIHWVSDNYAEIQGLSLDYVHKE